MIAAFLGAGLLNLIGRTQLREVYARCQYPTGYRYAAAIIYIGAAILLAGPYRVLGLALAAVLLFLMIVTLTTASMAARCRGLACLARSG